MLKLNKKNLDIHSRHRTKDHYDEKIFDEKIYEDIFHQIVSDPPKVSSNGMSNLKFLHLLSN